MFSNDGGLIPMNRDTLRFLYPILVAKGHSIDILRANVAQGGKKKAKFHFLVTKKDYGASIILWRVSGLVCTQNGRFFLTCARFWCIIIVFR
jgi:hypothetical protein